MSNDLDWFRNGEVSKSFVDLIKTNPNFSVQSSNIGSNLRLILNKMEQIESEIHKEKDYELVSKLKSEFDILRGRFLMFRLAVFDRQVRIKLKLLIWEEELCLKLNKFDNLIYFVAFYLKCCYLYDFVK